MTKNQIIAAKKILSESGYNTLIITGWERKAKEAGRRWRTYTNTNYRKLTRKV